jgi:hypothetical protein
MRLYLLPYLTALLGAWAPPVDAGPSADFSQATNSQYVALLLEDI